MLRAGIVSLLILWPLGSYGNSMGIVHMLNGDRMTGSILSETPTNIVFATDWNPKLSIPRSQIRSLERLMSPLPLTTAVKKPSPNTETVATKPKAAKAPAPTTPPTTIEKSAPKPAAKPVASKAKPKGKWSNDIRLGMDLRYSAVTQQTVHARHRSTFASKQFRNQTDWNFAYGKTADSVSADRMSGLMKSDWTFDTDWYVYNIGSAGYDIVRRIALQYEIGPGLGYHLIKGRKLIFDDSKFSLDLESGGEYEDKLSTSGRSTQRYFLRLAQILRWTINDDLTFTEEFEFYPRVADLVNHRYRVEGNIAYRLIKNLDLNLTVLAEADPQNLSDFVPDDIQLRTSIGWRF
jgi:hypothetical protein